MKIGFLFTFNYNFHSNQTDPLSCAKRLHRLFFCRYDSLLLVAGGIGITPFLSILKEIDFALSSGKKWPPAQIQLIYVVKKSQDVCLLDSVLPILLNRRAGQLHLKLKVFVTQEQSGAPISELLTNEFSKVETVNFGMQCSDYATHGVENLLWLAAIVGFSSIVFLAALSCFNGAFLHDPAKMASKQKQKKNPSSVTDLFLIFSFIIAIMCGTIVAVFLRWRKLKKELPPSPQKYVKELKPISVETSCDLKEHEIHFGRRPNFQGTIYNPFSVLNPSYTLIV